MSDLQPTVPQPDAAQPARRWRITRRGFLIGLGATAGALALGIAGGYAFGRPAFYLNMANRLDGSEGGPPSELPTDPWAWFEITPDNRLHLYVSKVEMGQGVHTAFAQAAAEELGMAPGDMEVFTAPTTRPPFDESGTSGSTSVSSTFTPLRTAAATLREMLAAQAAVLLGVPAADLVVDGRAFAVATDPAQRAEFAAIAASKADWEVPEGEVALKNPADFQVIGTRAPRVDIPAKVTGQAVYGYDVRVEGMKYGAVARPPTVGGKLVGAAAGSAATMPGVHTVVIEDGFAGVVADSRARAYAALNALELEWEPGKLWNQEEIDALVVAGDDGTVIQRAGNAPAQLRQQVTHSAEYRSPFAIQTPLEAQAALADVRAGGARIWTSTQFQYLARDAVAEVTGLEKESIEVIPTYLGGGFGRKGGLDVPAEAARLSKAAGVPVHVGWTRSEELRHGYVRPPTHSQLFARLDENGRITAIEHRQASGQVAFGFFPGFLKLLFGSDFGSWRGARLDYGIPNMQVSATLVPLPVQTGWWRGLGLLANTFAVETFMDELAQVAGADPLQFRLDHLPATADGERLGGVLRKAAELSGWGTPLPAGRARGIACCNDYGTCVAEVAELSFDEATGRIKVHNVWAAMDCGLVVNPDGAAAQVEGNVIWGLGSALLEEMRVENGQVVPANFDAYPLLTMKEAPHIEVALVESGTEPRGVGEPAIGPVAAAVGNAFFALTGARLRQIPFTPERVRAALAA